MDQTALLHQVQVMHPHNSCPACCMLGMFTCCSFKMQYNIKYIDNDTMAGEKFKICGCMPMSMAPCFMVRESLRMAC